MYHKTQKYLKATKKRHVKALQSSSTIYYPDKYYKRRSLTTCRTMSKKQTNKRLRQLSEEVRPVTSGAYRKVFDYHRHVTSRTAKAAFLLSSKGGI
ncbi:MAG: hypothetical protein FWE05_06120 [Defluviitaleaceae bacterium]|nr:hypothetical protein [Defluviitaleaceae bacterium]